MNCNNFEEGIAVTEYDARDVGALEGWWSALRCRHRRSSVYCVSWAGHYWKQHVSTVVRAGVHCSLFARECIDLSPLLVARRTFFRQCLVDVLV